MPLIKENFCECHTNRFFILYILKDDAVHVYLLKDKELVDKSLPKGKEKKKIKVREME